MTLIQRRVKAEEAALIEADAAKREAEQGGGAPVKKGGVDDASKQASPLVDVDEGKDDIEANQSAT